MAKLGGSGSGSLRRSQLGCELHLQKAKPEGSTGSGSRVQDGSLTGLLAGHLCRVGFPQSE